MMPRTNISPPNNSTFPSMNENTNLLRNQFNSELPRGDTSKIEPEFDNQNLLRGSGLRNHI